MGGCVWGAVGLIAAVALGLAWAMLSMEQINLRVGPSPLERALAAEVQTSTPPEGPETPVAVGTRSPSPTPRPSPSSGPQGTRPTPTVGATPMGTATPTPFPPGVQLTLLGDSIMLSTLPVWQGTLPTGSFFMDAKQGRRLAHLLTLVPELAQQERLGPTVVIHLGTNGSFTDATFDAVMRLLLEHGVRQVYFVNVRSPIRWAPLANAQLEAGVARWPEAYLLDWNAYATPHRAWFYEDFAHPTPEGARAYVTFILRGMGWLPQTATQEAP